jgi:hypothetical protein
VVLSQTAAQVEAHLVPQRAQHTAEAVELRSRVGVAELLAGVRHTTELLAFNSKVAIATMREAAVAAAGTAVVAALTLQMQTAHSWVVGAAVADLATLHFSPTVTPMQEVVRHQAEQLTDSHLQVHPHVQPA